jgi:hypothetical protein
MKKTRAVLILCLLSVTIVYTLQSQILPKDFQHLLQLGSMQYSVPPGFVATPVIENDDVAYDFAVKSTTGKLEIRYRIRPIEKQGHQDSYADPEFLFNGMVMTMGLNISNGQIVEPKPFPEVSVRSEFGADAGSSCAVHTDSEFGEGFKGCLISAIHKEKAADAYVFFMFDDMKTLSEALFTDRVYHALKFR